MFYRIKPVKLILAILLALLAAALLAPPAAYALTSTTAELRSDHLRAGSPVPAQGIFLKNNGNCFPLTSATVVTNTLGASYTTHPIGSTNNPSNSTGYWIDNPSLTAYASNTVPGQLVLKWTDIGYDTQGHALDMTLTISNLTIKESGNSTESNWVKFLGNNGNRLVVHANASTSAPSGSASAKIGVEMKVTVVFTRHDNGGTPTGNYLFSAVDLDMADRCTTAGSVYYPESGGYYTESIVLGSGFNSNVYFQADHTDGSDPGPTNLRINGNRIYGTAGNDHDDEMRNGFVVQTTGPSFSFNWLGSDCATALFREASGIHIDDKNVSSTSNASGHGIVTPSVSTAGIPNGGTARTADTYRVSTLSWKQNATYNIKAQPGYRVTTVQVIPESGSATTLNDPKTISFGPNAMNVAAGYFTSDRNYQIIVTTAAVSNATASLTAKKTLTGRSLAVGEFSFELYEGNTKLETKTNAADGTIAFSTLSYVYDSSKTYPITHTYTIKEVTSNLPANVRGDTSTKTVTVTENYNASTGAYSASISNNNPTFTNTFTPPDTTAKITAKKTLSGRPLTADEFSFELYEGNTKIETKTNAANGTVTFSTLTYSYNANTTYPKTHTYTIKEVSGSLPHVTYDGTTKTVTVTENYNSSTGDYSTSISNNNPTFSNTFTPPTTTVNLTAKKTLRGRNLGVGEFSFELYEGTNKIETKSNAADGTVAFSTITYTYDPSATYPKTHTYKIKEVAGNLPNVEYDTSEKTVTVTENYNTQTGAYTTSISGNNPTISNVFTPPSDTVTITAKKTLQGANLQARQFSFILADESSDIESIYNDANGNIAFTPIAFTYVPGDTYPKTHTYTIREVAGQEPFMIYDTERKTVTVTENYNTTTGAYDVTASPVPTFTNKYIPHSIQIEKTAARTHYENAKVGDPVTWNFTVTNTGSGALEGVYVADEYLGSTQVQLSSTSLAAQGSSGNSTTGSAVSYLTQEDIDRGWVENTAIAHGHASQWPSEDVVSQPSTARVTISQSPSILLVKTALETSVSPGNTVHYQFKITNTGNTTLTNVKLSDNILGINETVSAKLLPGESVTVGGASATGYSKVATSADLTAGKIDNTATTTGTPPSGANVTDTDTASVPVVPPTLRIEKTGALTKTDGVVQTGDTVLWTATITNTCNVTIDDIVLHDDYLTSKNITITPQKTSLAPGEHTTATATSPLSQDEVNAGSVKNTIKASGVVHATATDTVPVESNIDDAVVEYTRSAQLAITKTVDKATAEIGDTLEYEIVITNTGNVTLAPVTFKDELVGITGSGENSIAAQSLAPGASATLNVTYKPVSEADAAKGAVDNIVFANGTPPTGVTPPEEVSATAHTVITSKPALELTKTVDKQLIDPAVPGDVITWTFTLHNGGDITLGSLAIEDAQLSAAGVTVEIPSDDVIAPGQSKEYSATQAVAQADIDAGTIVNVATATGTTPGMSDPIKSNEATASVELRQHPAISLEKEVDKKEIPIAKSGDMLTYTFTVTNIGDVPVSNVVVEDWLAGVIWEPTGWTKKTYTDASTAEMDQLLPGESVERTATYFVTENDIAAGKVVNTAQAFADYGAKDLVSSNEATVETILGKENIIESREDDLASIMHTGDSPLPYVLVCSGISGVVALIMVRTRRRSR